MQVGVAGCVHVDDYERGVIKKHETTRPDKEDDRTRHILALDAHAEAVLLAYRRKSRDRSARDGDHGAAADLRLHCCRWCAPHGVEAVGSRAGASRCSTRCRAPTLPTAITARRAPGGPPARPATDHRRREREWFPAVLFPAEQLRILPYNRVIADLGGQTPGEVAAKLEQAGRLSVTAKPRAASTGKLLHLPGSPVVPPRADRILDRPGRSPGARWTWRCCRSACWGRSSASVIRGRTSGSTSSAGFEAPGSSKRASIPGGQRWRSRSTRRPSISSWPSRTSGRVMPPKSTWFEPKLASGLLVHPFDLGRLTRGGAEAVRVQHGSCREIARRSPWWPACSWRARHAQSAAASGYRSSSKS